MAKKVLINQIKDLFKQAYGEPRVKKLMLLPPILRIILGTGLVLFGLVGLVTPIPLGIVFVIIGVSLIVGLRQGRAYLLKFVHFTRLHILYGKIYVWYQQRGKKE